MVAAALGIAARTRAAQARSPLPASTASCRRAAALPVGASKACAAAAAGGQRLLDGQRQDAHDGVGLARARPAGDHAEAPAARRPRPPVAAGPAPRRRRRRRKRRASASARRASSARPRSPWRAPRSPRPGPPDAASSGAGTGDARRRAPAARAPHAGRAGVASGLLRNAASHRASAGSVAPRPARRCHRAAAPRHQAVQIQTHVPLAHRAAGERGGKEHGAARFAGEAAEAARHRDVEVGERAARRSSRARAPPSPAGTSESRATSAAGGSE